MPQVRWSGIAAIALALCAVAMPLLYSRWNYEHSKRLRVVVPGRVYRSGLMTAAGFTAAVRQLGIRTIVNLMDEAADPRLPSSDLSESDLCRQLGVRYVHLPPDLPPERDAQPAVLEQLLTLCDDPANYPILIHCKAGLHRTGVVVAWYRREYQDWPLDEALAELRANGFGRTQCTRQNDYIRSYLVNHRPRAARALMPVAHHGPTSATPPP